MTQESMESPMSTSSIAYTKEEIEKAVAYLKRRAQAQREISLEATTPIDREFAVNQHNRYNARIKELESMLEAPSVQ